MKKSTGFFYAIIICLFLIAEKNIGQQRPDAASPIFSGVNIGSLSKINPNTIQSIALNGNEFLNGGDRLAALQNTDGGWGWPLTGTSALNTVGPIAMGLAQAYQQSGSTTQLDALNKAAQLLLSKTNNFSPSDGYLAAQLDKIFGGDTYRTFVRSNYYTPLYMGFYNKNGAGTLYTTASYIQLIRESRTGSQANMAAWDLGMGLVGAAMCEAITDDWVAGVEAEINELDANNYYDVIGLAGALYGLAYVNADFDPTAGSHASANNIHDLAAILASYQIENGGFAWNSAWVIPNDGDEAVQETAYSILALNKIDRTTYLSKIQGAANYLSSIQLSTGGFQQYNYVGTTATENNEVTGEALWGISTAFPPPVYNSTMDVYFPTIQAAITNAVATSVINVSAGTYVEDVIVPSLITLIGADASTTKIVATSGMKSPLTFNGTMSTVSGFTLTHIYTTAELASWSDATPNNNGVTFSQNSSMNTLRECNINLNRNGIYLNTCQNNIISNNNIVNNRTGINMTGNVNGTTITNNIISDNWTIGLVSYANSNPGTNLINYSTITVTGNTFSNNWYSEVLIKDASAYSGVLDVTNNTFTDSPVTYCTSSNSIYNEPGNGALKPAVDGIGGTATKPSEDLPTLRIYNSGSVELKYDNPKTVIVDNGQSIQNAIDLANDNDIVELKNGTYQAIQIDKPLTLIGNGSTVQSGSPAMTVNSTGVTILGFIFDFDAADYAIDVLAGAYDVNIHSCDFINTNGASVGNGVRNQGTGTVDATLNFWNSITGPTASSNPGGVGNVALNSSTGFLYYNPWYTSLTHSTEVGGPILISPANTLTGVSIQPRLEWNPAGTISPYTVRISTHSDMSSPVILYTGTATNYTLTEVQKLLNNTTYFWQVTDNGGYTSPIWSFKTTPKVMVYNANPLTRITYVEYNPCYFSWYIGSETGSLKFILEYTKSTSAPNWITVSKFSYDNGSNLIYEASLDAGSKYYWRVVVKNADDYVVSYSDNFYFTTKSGASKPYLSYPIGGFEITSTTPIFYWYIGTYDLTNIDFNLVISTSSTFATTLHEYTNITDLYFEAPDALPTGTPLYWKVITYYKRGSADQQTFESSAGSFKIKNYSVPVKPYLSYPVGGVTVYSTTPTLYWYTGQYTENIFFDIYLREDDGNPFNSGDIVAADIEEFYFELTSSLDAGVNYKWQVVAKGNGPDQISATGKFKIATSLTYGSPIASWPLGNPTLYTSTPTLYWFISGSSVGINGYEYYYSTTNPTWNSSLTGTYLNGADQLYVELPTLAAGTYYWGIRAVYNTTPVSYSDWYHTNTKFKIESSASSIGLPYVAAPTGGITVYNTSVTLYWYVIGDASAINEYKVEWSKTSNWSLLESQDNITDQSCEITNLTPGATYKWRVYASTDGGLTWGTPSNPIGSFVVAPSASSSIVPIVGSPVNEVAINNTAATLSWFTPAPTQTQLKYDLEYSTDDSFNNSQKVTDLKAQSFTLEGLEKNKIYYWRVAAITDAGIKSGFSNAGSFKTSPVITSIEGENLIPTEFSLEQNYPNPFNPVTTISYSLPQNSFVTLKVYDMLGREIKTLVNQELSAGTKTIQWMGDDNFGNKVASGTYLYRIIAGNFVSVKKMLFLK